MSKQLLLNLNGNKKGELKKFLDNLSEEPRIAWYPSAGEDFRPLLYLHPSFAKLSPPSQPEPEPPDLFLFTDYFPWKYSTFLDKPIIYADDRTFVSVGHIEELPNLNLLPLHDELVDFTEGSIATDRALFLKTYIHSDKLGSISHPVIYAFAENETFYCRKLAPANAIITHIIHVRYGGSGCGGGKASGIWLLNVLKQLKCEVFITDGHHYWQSGDEFALEFCPSIPRQSDAKLTPIRILPGYKWSGHGDVSWNLVT